MKQFCSPREDPKTEMAAISEETFSQTVSIVFIALKERVNPSKITHKYVNQSCVIKL